MSIDHSRDVQYFKEVHGKLRLYASFLEYGRHVGQLRRRRRRRAIPLAKITMRKSTHGFPLSFPCMMSMGLRLATLRAAGAPLLNSPKLAKMFLSGNVTKRWCSSSCYCIFRRYRWYVLRVPNDIHLTIAEFASPGVSEA